MELEEFGPGGASKLFYEDPRLRKTYHYVRLLLRISKSFSTNTRSLGNFNFFQGDQRAFFFYIVMVFENGNEKLLHLLTKRWSTKTDATYPQMCDGSIYRCNGSEHCKFVKMPCHERQW